MSRFPPEVLALAESLNLNMPPREGEERVIDERYAAILGVEDDPHHNVVQRLRLGNDPREIAAVVAEVRALFAARGRRQITWEVGDSATPGDLVARLEAEGMRPFEPEPLAVGMALREPLVGPFGEVSVRPVSSLDDFRIASAIYQTCFQGGAPSTISIEALYESKTSVPAFRSYLAWVGDRAVAAADAVFLPFGVVMCGGATLPEARGKGAYRALVAARWEEGRRAGTPTLITQAGSMSRPILARLGFEEVVKVFILLDTF